MDELLTFNITDIYEALDYLEELSTKKVKHLYDTDKEIIKKDIEHFFKYKTEKEQMYLVLGESGFVFSIKTISDELSS